MRCQVLIPHRDYSRPGYCGRRDVRVVRWAPTPMRTKVYRLCGTHARILMDNGKLNTGTNK